MSKQTEERYFNFPVQTLEGFMLDHVKCLVNIFDYSLVNSSIEMNGDTEIEKLESACKAFKVTPGNINSTLKNGKKLIGLHPHNSPMTGIKVGTWFEYYREEKKDFEKACLIAFLAMKSIIGDKAYCKLTNAYFLARMDGKTKAVQDFSELSPEIKKYANEYQTVKIKNALFENWNLATYSQRTAGFFASIKLDIKELALEVEKSKRSEKYQAGKLRIMAQNARSEALRKLNGNTT